MESKSFDAWLQGMYIFNAISVAIGNASRKKGAKALKYIEEPIRITPMNEREKEEYDRKGRQKVIDFLNGFQKDFNKSIGGG